MGRAGAGKTTLVNLISRLYDVDEGEIYLDGIPVKELAFHDLRKNVAMVSQDTYIFMGTVADNIAYANPEATREDVVQAAILASAHEFIANMPDGYDTVIGASGKDLSGGEKQRISIARAILANPKILILDEATASVDTETEKAIQNSLNYLVKGRTTLSIAHRLSTLRDANHLVVIDGGKIVEEGTHKELEKKQVTIALALKSSDELDLGITDRRTCRLLVSNMLGKPLYWEETISWDFGEYSRKKHELCILELGRDFPAEASEYSAESRMWDVYGAYMSDYFEENYPVYDENGKIIEPW